MNTDDLDTAIFEAERRVLKIQTKLHQWAGGDPHCRFDDLFNLVTDPAFLLVAWARVRANKGARTPGVDGRTTYYVEEVRGVEDFLDELRLSLKDRSFRPLPVRERMIPKSNGKLRRLGIATVTDRVVQASVKLVLEPIFEADFLPCSYGFRPKRRAHDAVAEVRHMTSRSFEWVVEGDITACFDEIAHAPLMERVRKRVGDKRVLALVKAFLKAGILSEDRTLRATSTGTPQGSILSPLLSNVALSVLDEHIAHAPGGPSITRPQRRKRWRHGLPNYRLVRYADDWCLVVSGSRADAEALRDEIADVLSTIGLRLSQEKTLITHISEGLDFLGWRIQRHRKRGTSKHFVYLYPAKKALRAIMAKVKTLCRQDLRQSLDDLLRRLNSVLRGWTAYFRHGSSKATFRYLRAYVWKQVFRRLRRKHRRTNWKKLRRQHTCDGWWPATSERTLFNPAGVKIVYYSYRGGKIPHPGRARHETPSAHWDVWRARCLVTGTPGSGSGPEKPTSGNTGRALRADFALTMATIELWKAGHRHRPTGQWKAGLSFTLGIGLSLCANIASAPELNAFSIAVAACFSRPFPTAPRTRRPRSTTLDGVPRPVLRPGSRETG